MNRQNFSVQNLLACSSYYICIFQSLQFSVIDKRLIADKCARKHVCGHFCGMKGNNAYLVKGHALFQILPVAQMKGHY